MRNMMRGLVRPTLHVGLSPEAVEMATFDWRGRLVRQGRFPAAPAQTGWQGAMASFREQLRGDDWSASAAEVILSSHFLRQHLLPGDTNIGGAAEQGQYMRHVFRGEYGAAVDGWRIATDRGGRGTRLACAMDAALFDDIVATCRAARIRPRSVLPNLVAAANRNRRQVRQSDAWFAVLESDICALALLESGRWRHVACARLGASGGASLFGLLRQQEMLCNAAPSSRTVYVCGATHGVMEADDARSWKVELLARAGGAARSHLLPC